MKSPQQMIEARIQDMMKRSFQDLGISEKALEKLEPYLEGEMEESEFFAWLPQLDLYAKTGIATDGKKYQISDITKTELCIRKVHHFKDMTKNSIYAKYIRALFYMSAETITAVEAVQISQLIEFYQKCGLTRGQLAAIWASSMIDIIIVTQFPRVYAFLKNGSKKEMTGSYQSTPVFDFTEDDLYEGIQICRGIHKNPKILLQALFLHMRSDGYKGKKQKHSEEKNYYMKLGCNEQEKKVIAELEITVSNLFSSIFDQSVSNDTVKNCLECLLEARKGKDVWKPKYENELKNIQYTTHSFIFICMIAYWSKEYSQEMIMALKLLWFISKEECYVQCISAGGQQFINEIIKARNLGKNKVKSFLNWVGGWGTYQYSEALRKQILTAMNQNYPEWYLETLKEVDSEKVLVLLEYVSNKEKIRLELNMRGDTAVESFRGLIKTNLQIDLSNAVDQYLKEEADYSVILPYEKVKMEWDWNVRKRIDANIREYRKICGETTTYRRMLVLFVLHANYYMLDGIFPHDHYSGYSDIARKNMKILYEEMPVATFLAIFSTLYLNGSVWYLDLMKPYYEQIYKEKKEEFIAAISGVSAEGREYILKDITEKDEKNLSIVIDYFGDSSKMVRKEVVNILSTHQEMEKEVLEKLQSKKAAERETAVLVLQKWDMKSYEESLRAVLEKEKSVKVSGLIREVLNDSVEESTEEKTVDGYIKEVMKGNKKATLAWLYQTPFSAVHKKDGTLAEELYMQAILISYSSMNQLGINHSVEILTNELKPEELGVFVGEVFDKWMEQGAQSKRKWVLYFASIHGGIEIVTRLKHQIQEWPKASRGSIAADAVKALALNPSQSALLIVDNISRKFKFRQVKAAAGQALEYAASELGLTKEELSDKIVPDLSFDRACKRIFDYGTRKFTVYLTPALEIEVYDESNKKLKNLPAPAKKDEEEKAKAAYAEFKLMKKEMKTTIATQKQRLELALAIERKWTLEAFTELFVDKPVMHQFAIGLVWGLYENGELKETFRYTEEGTYNTKDEEEPDFEQYSGDVKIALIHPVELEEQELNLWKEQLSDYEIVQPIVQLERPIYAPTEEEKTKDCVERFGGRVINGLSLSGKLFKAGWYRGSVEDAGGYYSFYTESEELGIGAELSIEGLFVGMENEDTTVYELRFYKAKTVQRGSYIYDQIKKENQYHPDQVPKKFFSEILYQVEIATASYSEIKEDWELKK